MNIELENLKSVELEDGRVLSLKEVLGQGGQGVVYRTDNSNFAVKLVIKDEKPITDPEFIEKYNDRINELLCYRFQDDVTVCRPISKIKGYAGYVMNLLSKTRPVSALLYNNADNKEEFYKATGGMKKRLEVLLELSRVMAKLHAEGYVYGDLSHNNVFVSLEEENSKVWLIDTDNITWTIGKKTLVYTPDFAAPELLAHNSFNTSYSDCFSFAVLSFYLLANHNPIKEVSNLGSSVAWDATVTQTSVSNESVVYEYFLKDEYCKEKSELLNAFNGLIPSNILELFRKTFVDGMLDNQNRPTMSTWHKELTNAICSVYECNCGNQYSLKMEEPECIFCKTTPKPELIASVYQVFDNSKIYNDDFSVDLGDENISFYLEKNIPMTPNFTFTTSHICDLVSHELPFNLFETELKDRTMKIKVHDTAKDIITVSDANGIKLSKKAQEIINGVSYIINFNKYNIKKVLKITKRK